MPLAVDSHRIADRNDVCEYPIDFLIAANVSSDVRLSLEYKGEAPEVLFLYILIRGLMNRDTEFPHVFHLSRD